jgi:hypothetical protein
MGGFFSKSASPTATTTTATTTAIPTAVPKRVISYEKTEDDEKERTLSSEMKRDLVVMKSLVENSAPKEEAVITELPEEEELPVPGSGSVVEPTDETADETAAESIPTRSEERL